MDHQQNTNPLKSPNRLPGLDLFRGVTIVLMFLFTLIGSLSTELPALLSHNEFTRLLPGDFVLSFFLFASGLSLPLFYRRYAPGPAIPSGIQHRALAAWLPLSRKTVTKLFQLLAVSLFVTPFSVLRLYGMDEVMLAATLFLPGLLSVRLPSRVLWVIIWGIFLGYFFCGGAGYLPNFRTTYLGGYAGAVLYFPVVLGGILFQRSLSARLTGEQRELKGLNRIPLRFFLQWGVTSLCLLYLIYPYKMLSAPSFMAVSVLLSAICYLCCEWLVVVLATNRSCLSSISSKLLNSVVNVCTHVGRTPLRFWVLMFVAIGPVRWHAERELGYPRMNLDWGLSLGIVVLAFSLAYLLSRLFDLALKLMNRILSKIPS